MNKWITVTLALALFLGLACQEEETLPPEPQTPAKESTVEVIATDAWDPDWSPDAKSLVFIEEWHVTVMELSTSAKTIITPEYGSSEFCPRSPIWLASDKIAFLRKDETTRLYDAYVVPATGGELTKYELDADEDGGLGCSPDGNYLYFTNRGDKLIYRYDIVNLVKTRITNQHVQGFILADPIPKPNSDKIYFAERELPFNRNPHTEYINEVIARPGYVPNLVYQTTKPFWLGLTVSPDGAYLVFPREQGLYAVDVATGVDRWLTRAPSAWTDKDCWPAYSPNGDKIAFTRSGDVCICEGL